MRHAMSFYRSSLVALTFLGAALIGSPLLLAQAPVGEPLVPTDAPTPIKPSTSPPGNTVVDPVADVPVVPVVLPLETAPNYFGFSVRQIGPGQVIVHEVIPGSPAAQAAVEVGDQLVGINTLPVTDVVALEHHLATVEPKGEVEFSFLRGDDVQDLVLQAAQRPAAANNEADVPALDNSRETLLLGMTLNRDDGGTVVVTEVAPNSPAANVGVLPGDVLVSFGDLSLRPWEKFLTSATALVQNIAPGEVVHLRVTRNGQPLTLTFRAGGPQATQAAAPPQHTDVLVLQHPVETVLIGLILVETQQRTVIVESVLPGSPAALAGLQRGDVLLAIEDQACHSVAQFAEYLQLQRVGNQLNLQMARNEQPFLAELHIVPRLADLASLARQQAMVAASQQLGQLHDQVQSLSAELEQLRRELDAVGRTPPVLRR